MNSFPTGLESLPSSWRMVPLKAVASYEVSNVDKHSHSDELPVRLCNYTDVYKNDRITLDMDLMRATATEDEISKFHLEVDDVVITKDSETWNDIAVPALITETDEDLVCGYHLAILRAMPHVLSGKYLMRAVQSRPVALQLELASTGVTRCGLPKGAIGSAKIPLPDLPTQQHIVSYLDRETARIDDLVAEKQRMLVLLEQKRAALISRAVTLGLNPKAATKSSGLDWLGDIPGHWGLERSKRYFIERDERSVTGDEEMLTVSHITGVTPRSDKDVNMFEAASNEGYKLVSPGQLVINTLWAWMGAMGVARHEGIVSPAYHVYQIGEGMLPAYADWLVRIPVFKAEVIRFSKGVWSSRLRLYPEGLHQVWIPIPPLNEQIEIVAYLKAQQERTAVLEATLCESIGLLKERRSALITAAVTGKISPNEMTS